MHCWIKTRTPLFFSTREDFQRFCEPSKVWGVFVLFVCLFLPPSFTEINIFRRFSLVRFARIYSPFSYTTTRVCCVFAIGTFRFFLIWAKEIPCSKVKETMKRCWKDAEPGFWWRVQASIKSLTARIRVLLEKLKIAWLHPILWWMQLWTLAGWRFATWHMQGTWHMHKNLQNYPLGSAWMESATSSPVSRQGVFWPNRIMMSLMMADGGYSGAYLRTGFPSRPIRNLPKLPAMSCRFTGE